MKTRQDSSRSLTPIANPSVSPLGTTLCVLPSIFCAHHQSSFCDPSCHYSHGPNKTYSSNPSQPQPTPWFLFSCLCPVIILPSRQPGWNFQTLQLGQVTLGLHKWLQHTLRSAFLVLLRRHWLPHLPVSSFASRSLNVPLRWASPQIPPFFNLCTVVVLQPPGLSRSFTLPTFFIGVSFLQSRYLCMCLMADHFHKLECDVCKSRDFSGFTHIFFSTFGKE